MSEERVMERCASLAGAGAGLGARIERHMDALFRLALGGGAGVTMEEGFVRVVTGEAHPLGNFALVRDGSDEAAAREAAGALVECGAPSAVLITGTEIGAGVESYLRGAGFERAGDMPAMAVETGSVAAAALGEGYVFERVCDEGDWDAWEGALAEGYELPRSVAALFSPRAMGVDASAGASVQFFAVRAGSGGPMSATSMLYLGDGLAGVYCVATLERERGKGLGAHVTAGALRAAAALGYGVGVLQSSAMGESVYRRLGFESLGGVALYVRMPG